MGHTFKPSAMHEIAVAYFYTHISRSNDYLEGFEPQIHTLFIPGLLGGSILIFAKDGVFRRETHRLSRTYVVDMHTIQRSKGYYKIIADK